MSGMAADRRPALGAFRCAEMLTTRLGLYVSPAAVKELAARGLIAPAGGYKGNPLYDLATVEAFTDTGTAQAITAAERWRGRAASIAYLGVRGSDFTHLTRSGMLRPAGHGQGPYDRRRQATVPLYRTGDLDTLLARPDIDWAAVRATPPGRPSLLIQIAETERTLAALAGIGVCEARLRHDGGVR
jgi:hypothetical protein